MADLSSLLQLGQQMQFRLSEIQSQLAQQTVTCSAGGGMRSEEHTSELQSQSNLVCRPLLEKNKHSSDADSRPPYVLMAFAIGFTCSAVLIAVGYRAGGSALTVLTVVVLYFVWPLVTRWMCRGCGATYTAPRPKRP